MISELETQRLLDTLRQTKASMQRINARLSEPLAIIGIGCRFPDCEGPGEFWKMLVEGHRAALRSGERWPESLRADREKQPGKITANRGGFLDAIDQFDNGFFGISGREAVTLDPQHRLLLEVAWETFENAAIDPTGFRGAKIGSFVGICSNDYLHRLTQRPIEEIDTYFSTGNSHGAAAGRLNYFMDWRGPALSIDTACSSSLNALHLAARSLRYGDCEMALVMGVNVILAPELSISLSQAGMLSPTGRCHAFSADADGFARGEGCGGILLKRLSQAEQDGDRILCVVRGTASNQDGRSNGLTAPNGQAQEQVIRAALEDAKLRPEDIDYVEAHGTGTPLGDPIELGALQSVFAPGRIGATNRTEQPLNVLRVGSVKANLGHLEGAAGIAGVIKLALSIYHATIPPHPSFQSPSDRIDWNWPVEVPTKCLPWFNSERIRTAGVSSFGFGGSNAHAIIGQYIKSSNNEPKATTKQSLGEDQAESVMVVLSAKTKSALQQQALRWADFLKTHSPDLANVSYTAAVGRTAFDHRLAVVGRSRESIASMLAQAATHLPDDNLARLLIANEDADCEGVALNRVDALKQLADRYLSQAKIDWKAETVLPWIGDAQKIELPTYPYQRVRRWYDAASGRAMLGRRLDLAGEICVFENALQDFHYLKEHVVDGMPILPASGYLEIASAAGVEVFNQLCEVCNLRLLRPIFLEGAEQCKLQVHLRESEAGRNGTIDVKVGEAWRNVADFLVRPLNSDVAEPFQIPIEWRTPNNSFSETSVEGHYRRASSIGIEYGPAFRGIEKLYCGTEASSGFAYGIVANLFAAQAENLFHPAVLDACFQVAAAASPELKGTWLPASIKKYRLVKRVDDQTRLQVWAHVDSELTEPDETLHVSIRIEEVNGAEVASIYGLELKRLHIRPQTTIKSGAHVVNTRLDSDPELASLSLMDFLHARVADVMGLSLTEVPSDQPLDSLGLDSLMAFELRDEIERKYQISLPMEFFLEDVTIEKFCKAVEASIQLEPSNGWVEGEI